MALTILNALALLDAHSRGESFERTITLARVDGFLAPKDLDRIASAIPSRHVDKFIHSNPRPRFMDFFFRALGATTLDAIDASDFEGASILHDMNEPVRPELWGRYDAVVDHGALEHIFNTVVALRNAMEMLRVGGVFYGASPTNNYCGHGFYQFSPEFFFRIFTAENGFHLSRMWVAPCYVGGRWVDGPVYLVKDPAQIRARVEIEGRRKMVLLVEAKKTKDVQVFAKWPQQSDYFDAWQGTTEAPVKRRKPNPFLSDHLAYALHRVSGLGRVAERIAERRIWRSQCALNPALQSYKWSV